MSKEEFKEKYTNASELTCFLEMKPKDFIILSGFRHQKLMLGVVGEVDWESESPIKVNWIREITSNLFDGLTPHFYRPSSIVNISSVKDKLLRHYLPLYESDGKYHIIVHVRQEGKISLKSLLGIQSLIYEQATDPNLEVKVHLESPGILEFISEQEEMILLIFQLISLLLDFKKKKRLRKEVDRLLYEKYKSYEIEQLELELLNNCEKVTGQVSKEDEKLV